MKPTFIKGYRAETDIAPFRFVAYGPDDGTAIQSTNAADAKLGVSDSLGAAEGQMADVIRQGIGEVEYAANIAAGDPLNADADGKAVVVAAGEPYAARAEHEGVAGTIGNVWLEAGVVPAAAP